MKKTITEITEKFGTDGKIIERITKTTTEESAYTLPVYPCYPDWTYRPNTITCKTTSGYLNTDLDYAQTATTTTTTATSLG